MKHWRPPRVEQPRPGGNSRSSSPLHVLEGQRAYIARERALSQNDIAPKDLAFCAELAFHGGTAASAEGFKAESELLRLHGAGLLDIYREEAPPFLIVKVTLSDSARGLLAVPNWATKEAPLPTPQLAPMDAPRMSVAPVRAVKATGDSDARRHAFEVARGIITAAIKGESEAWKVAGGPGGCEGIQQRIMGLILSLSNPFAT